MASLAIATNEITFGAICDDIMWSSCDVVHTFLFLLPIILNDTVLLFLSSWPIKRHSLKSSQQGCYYVVDASRVLGIAASHRHESPALLVLCNFGLRPYRRAAGSHRWYYGNFRQFIDITKTIGRQYHWTQSPTIPAAPRIRPASSGCSSPDVCGSRTPLWR